MNAHVGRLETREKVLRLHGSAFVADPSGVLYWPDEHLLLVADLHPREGLVLRHATGLPATL